MDTEIRQLYERVESHARTNRLTSVLMALTSLLELFYANNSVDSRLLTELQDCLLTTNMLIDIHPNITVSEEETLLTATIVAACKKNFSPEDRRMRLSQEPIYSHDVYNLLDIILPGRGRTDAEQQAYYRRVQENKLALLILMANRGVVIQQLHRYSSWNAQRIIDETRACYYPMCIYGKEHYHDLLASLSILMEKMRSLSEVAEILLRRYEVREAELMQDILALQEENATIRGIIAKFREDSSETEAP